MTLVGSLVGSTFSSSLWKGIPNIKWWTNTKGFFSAETEGNLARLAQILVLKLARSLRSSFARSQLLVWRSSLGIYAWYLLGSLKNLGCSNSFARSNLCLVSALVYFTVYRVFHLENGNFKWVPSNLSIFGPMLVKPKCVWEVQFFSILENLFTFLSCLFTIFQKTATSQTHFGSTNVESNSHNFEDTLIWNFHFQMEHPVDKEKICQN